MKTRLLVLLCLLVPALALASGNAIEARMVVIRTITVNPDSSVGEWDAYIHGPVRQVPWAQDDAKRTASNGGADAIPAGRSFRPIPASCY